MNEYNLYEKFDKSVYSERMSDFLPLLRAHLNINQEKLAYICGSSRQMISLIERKLQPMKWDLFLSCLMIFERNDKTRDLLWQYGIMTAEMEEFLNIRP